MVSIGVFERLLCGDGSEAVDDMLPKANFSRCVDKRQTAAHHPFQAWWSCQRTKASDLDQLVMVTRSVMIGAGVVEWPYGKVKLAQRQSEGFWTTGEGIATHGHAQHRWLLRSRHLDCGCSKKTKVFEREWRCLGVVRKRRELAEQSVENGRREGGREF